MACERLSLKFLDSPFLHQRHRQVGVGLPTSPRVLLLRPNASHLLTPKVMAPTSFTEAQGVTIAATVENGVTKSFQQFGGPPSPVVFGGHQGNFS